MSAKNRAARNPTRPDEWGKVRMPEFEHQQAIGQQTAPKAAKSRKPAVSRAGGHSRGLIPTEHQEQVAVIQWWEIYAASRGIDPRLLFAIPNGGARSKRTGAMLKAEGVRAGCPDLMLAMINATVHGITWPGMFIELKAEDGSVQATQREFAKLVRKAGYKVILAWGADEAIRAIRVYCEWGLPADLKGK